MDTLLTDLINAYYDAAKNSLCSKSLIAFQRNLSVKIIKLYREIQNQKYKHGRCTCFFVYKPVIREIFAPNFKDRIVQHLLFNYLYDFYDRKFIYDSYACRKNKGTSFGIKRMQHHIRSCSQNYQQKATFILKLDIKSFFRSIDRNILYEIVSKDIIRSGKFKENLKTILFLLDKIIFFDPTKGCYKKIDKKVWTCFPKSKSQFYAEKNKGIPIGSIMSQLLANILLHKLDTYIKRELKFKHYGRYVDDFYLIDRDKKKLLETIPLIEEYLENTLNLTLHPDKIVIRKAIQGITFLGAYILPHGTFIDKKTHKRAQRRYNEIYQDNQMNIYSIQQTIRSYKTILGSRTIS